MNLHSFRLKLALLSGIITGLLLVGTGVVLWRITYDFNLSRLDREILNLGQPNLDRDRGPVHFQRLEGALGFLAGEEPPRSTLILVRGADDDVIFQSHHWPTNLAASSFAPLEGPLLPRPGRGEMGPLPPPLVDFPDGPPPRRELPPLPRRVPRFETRIVNGQPWRFGIMGNPRNTLILGMNVEQFNADLHRLRKACLLGLPLVLLLAGLGSWFLAQRALRPVAALTRTAEGVTARGLDQRIPEMPRDQEFNRLITVFNEMLDRLEKSFRQATRFSADASHELKTPLARLQVELEQALESAPAGSDQQEVYSSMLDEISRLKAIVQKLLLLSLADAGQLKLTHQPVDLTRMLANVIEDCQAQAPELTVEHALASDVRVQADPDLLEQALQNLASNAIKYNRKGGRIRVELRKEQGAACVCVCNTGAAIPEADQARLFERFYRADPARSGRVDGVGLGLSLSREILRVHGGDLNLAQSNAERTCFEATLPMGV